MLRLSYCVALVHHSRVRARSRRVCAGRLICLTLSMSATLRGRPWRCNGDAQLVMGVAARAKPPPCNVERRSIPNSRDSRFSTPWTFLCPPSTAYCCAYIDVGGKPGARRGSSDDDGRRCVETASWSEPRFTGWTCREDGGFRVITGGMVGLIRARRRDELRAVLCPLFL